MVALIVGILFVAFAIISVMPFAFGWWPYVVDFLRGSVPVVALLVGLIAVFIGIADIKDRIEAKKEEEDDARMAEDGSSEGKSKGDGPQA